MITYYTSLGRMITKDENGSRIPIIVVDEKEYYLDIDELIVWGSLHWNFLNRIDLEKEFNRRRMDAHLCDDASFSRTLERLLTRKLVAEGTNYLAADALYELVGTLKIRPVKMNIWDKIKSSAYLYFVRGVSFHKCCQILFGRQLTPNEKLVLKLSENVGVSASEIIKCADADITEISNTEEIINKLYGNDETEEKIASVSRFSKLKTDVLQAVANLYLKKKIVFEN